MLDHHDPWFRLSPRAAQLDPSATLEGEADAEAAAAHEGRAVARLGLGQSPFSPPAPVTAALRIHAGETYYTSVSGLAKLRSAVAKRYEIELDRELDPDDVLIGPGSKPLIFLLQLAFEGDVLIPTPGWVSYAPQARLLGHRVLSIPTRAEDRWHLDPRALDEVCRTSPPRPRLLILNYPCNPTGTTFDPPRLQALADVAREHELLVLSDEIYGRLHHLGDHHSIATWYPEATIVAGGLSKWAGAGGWRLGHLVFPRRLEALRRAVAAAASESYTSTCTPVQHAAEFAYRREDITQPYLRVVRAILAALARELVARLEASGIEVVAPDGGFYLFPDFSNHAEHLADRGIHDDQALCERLLEECAVGILPGSEFGREPGELMARLAYVDFDGDTAYRSARRHLDRGERLDGDWVATYCRPTIDGIDRVCAWLD